MSRENVINRMETVLTFLEGAEKYHGAFSHWYDNSGNTIEYGDMDDGGDIVETALLIQGLMSIRQYFSNDNELEIELRNRITNIWEDDVGEVQNVLRTSWLNDPFTKGAYSFPRFNNSEEDFENLAEPIDNRLFFCGEHTNLKYLATTHGALFSGIRAAKEVIKASEK